MVRSNSHEFEAQGRVLRLKQYISADVRPAAINAILEALAVNTLVEVLYIQNFEQVPACCPNKHACKHHACTVKMHYHQHYHHCFGSVLDFTEQTEQTPSIISCCLSLS